MNKQSKNCTYAYIPAKLDTYLYHRTDENYCLYSICLTKNMYYNKYITYFQAIIHKMIGVYLMFF